MFDPVLAEKRFGLGLSASHEPIESIEAMLHGLTGPDQMAEAYPVEPFALYLDRIEARRDLNRKKRRAKTQAEADAAEKELKTLTRATRAEWRRWMLHSTLRMIDTKTAFRERLALFWTDHFTVVGKRSVTKSGAPPFIESAIRPHIADKFEDLLIAAALHPMMQQYLDQDISIGPNSKVARVKGQGRGLNENLAREILELHTLGVNGPYTQTDVRELAKLLTGLTWTGKEGLIYMPQRAEPGAERILGKWYGSQTGALGDVIAALRDLARHPATAQHLAEKLARHFVADQPDPTLIDSMRAAYLASDGDLTELCRAMLRHPSAWPAQPANMKQPLVFVASALRALGLDPQITRAWKPSQIHRYLLTPLEIMGQPWQKPLGPDGWPEDDAHWSTPQGLAARLQWALRLPEILGTDLPDPREFVSTALGPTAPKQVVFAANAAESRREGIALVLMSPAFQRQ